MPLGREIVELLEAIPDRIEVSGTGPTWRVTGGSFDSVVSWANDAFDDPVVIAREDRSRWWPRVTLTVTTDPGLAAEAPPLAAFTEPDRPEPESAQPESAQPESAQPESAQPESAQPESPEPESPEPESPEPESPEPEVIVPAAPAAAPEPTTEPTTDEEFSPLEEIFASQEAARVARRFPEQRARGRETR
jgi:outer membrane biosynthesis protein TonB